jgi:uncharacterized membrane protein YbhN (UPF0104 family)
MDSTVLRAIRAFLPRIPPDRTLASVPEDVAIGAALLYRLVTAYLPPIWEWVSLVWLRRHEMV